MIKRDYILNSEEEKLFDEFGIGYNKLRYEYNNKVDTQKYIYSVAKKKSLDNTAIPKLLDMTLHEIDTQYIRKEHMENRNGFLIALWGILLNILFQKDFGDKIRKMMVIPKSVNEWIGIVMLVTLFLLILFSLLFLILGTWSKTYYRFKYEDREKNFKGAADDKELSYIAMLEASTNAWEKNERTSRKQGKYLNWSIILLGCYSLALFIIAYIF